MAKRSKKRVARRRSTKRRRGSNPAEELVILGLANPHRGHARRRRNSSDSDAAADLYRTFHGRDPQEILNVQQSAVMRKDYTALGDLDYVVFIPDGKKEACKIEFEKQSAPKLASNPEGTQLYFIGGNQDLTDCLEEFPGDHSKDFIDLGECARVSYFARKSFDNFNPVFYYHDLGEEGGARPRGFYNKLQKTTFLVGGDYKVEAPGITN